MRSFRFVVAVMVLGSSVASAQEDGEVQAAPARGQGWSMHGGQTLGEGSMALSAQMGFPGFSFTLLSGVADKIDLGGRLSVNYGYEYMTHAVPVGGTKLEAVLRLNLIERSRLNLGLRFTPGMFVYFPGGGSFVGMTLPTSFILGINAGSAVAINVGFDLPMFVTFGPAGGLSVPVLFGGGVEYFLDRSLAVSFNTKMGAVANPAPGIAVLPRNRTPFAFEMLVGVSYKL